MKFHSTSRFIPTVQSGYFKNIKSWSEKGLEKFAIVTEWDFWPMLDLPVSLVYGLWLFENDLHTSLLSNAYFNYWANSAA